MIASIAISFLIATACASPARPYQHSHFHHSVSDSPAHPTGHPTGYPPAHPTGPSSGHPTPPMHNVTLPGQNSTGNGTVTNTTAVAWLPRGQKVRGVNLGSLFIIEPWMAYDEFNSMGCGDLNDEWECVKSLGQEEADKVFATHWDTWITQEDIAYISGGGLNVIRVPVGFWMKEDLVQTGEYYPRGALKYLDRLVGWAADAGLYVIMDLHGGPGSQSPNQQFTGHGVKEPGFYTPNNYERAVEFLAWMTQRIHFNSNYRTTGVLQVMNEPVHAADSPEEAADMLENFYPAAYSRIRDMEKSLGVPARNELNIQFMGIAWGAGDPTEYLPSNATNLLFDDHRYYKWDTMVNQTKNGYLDAVCSDNRGGNDLIMGEISLAISDDYQNTPTFAITSTTSIDGTEVAVDLERQKAWYQSFFAAQVQTFEKSGGWIFWTYKCNWVGGIDEWRWCYQSAVANGVIPEDVSTAASLSPCS